MADYLHLKTFEGSSAALYAIAEGDFVVVKQSRDVESKVFHDVELAGGHPNILHLLDLKTKSDGTSYMTLEYCENGDFLDLLNAGPIGDTQCLTYFAQIVSAVAFLHGLGYSHTDLSFENVLLGPRREAKLMDFGYCKRLDHLLRGRSGKEPFMAPEMFTGRNWAPGPTDVWALGMMLFTLFTREYMFPDGVTAAYDLSNSLRSMGIRGVLARNPEWQSRIPPACVRLLDVMLVFNPARRISIDRLLKRIETPTEPSQKRRSMTSSQFASKRISREAPMVHS
ncbi:hypothetical protein AeMF1_019405 [Aphanomyces euteiches]|nr:hypothetical protein AeMF1_019405 [Aphanomyces euteiches]KAH9193341.1 hypothetical protein AeNC1_004689 [Aphanomyces euteiches]